MRHRLKPFWQRFFLNTVYTVEIPLVDLGFLQFRPIIVAVGGVQQVGDVH